MSRNPNDTDHLDVPTQSLQSQKSAHLSTSLVNNQYASEVTTAYPLLKNKTTHQPYNVYQLSDNTAAYRQSILLADDNDDSGDGDSGGGPTQLTKEQMDWQVRLAQEEGQKQFGVPSEKILMEQPKSEQGQAQIPPHELLSISQQHDGMASVITSQPAVNDNPKIKTEVENNARELQLKHAPRPGNELKSSPSASSTPTPTPG